MKNGNIPAISSAYSFLEPSNLTKSYELKNSVKSYINTVLYFLSTYCKSLNLEMKNPCIYRALKATISAMQIALAFTT